MNNKLILNILLKLIKKKYIKLIKLIKSLKNNQTIDFSYIIITTKLTINNK